MNELVERPGISLNATMRGTLPARPGAQPGSFSASFSLALASLERFLDASGPGARLTRGTVHWDGVCAGDTPLVDGAFAPYAHAAASQGALKFRLGLRFAGDDGTSYDLDSVIEPADGTHYADIDALPASVRVLRANDVVATGQLHVNFDELTDQRLSLQPDGAPRPALSHGLREPLNPDELRALRFIAQAVLPNPLPANGPTLSATVRNLEAFVQNASGGALDELRRLLKVAGKVTPILDVTVVRTLLRLAVWLGNSELLAAIDSLKLALSLPYYAHGDADRLVGYERPAFEPARRLQLPTTRLPSTTRRYDVVIAGAGVAGSLLAQRLATKGQSVLVLEAGFHQAEHRITNDEVTMTARLYKRSGLQNCRQSFPVLQARCVGGGGVLNNAICFQLPDSRLERWQRGGFPFDRATMRDAYAAVAGELGIRPVSEAVRPDRINPAVRFLEPLGPVRPVKVDEPPPPGLSECLVNLDDCRGCGLCNTGCGEERKRNAYQVYLPQALRRDCTLVPEARVVDIALADSGQVTHLVVEVAGQRLEVRGQRYVLAAGAIASSELLLRSQVAAKLPQLPTGQRFSANVGCPTFVFSHEVLHQRTSVQIAHAYMQPGDEGFVIESWFAPPGAFALAVPGYFAKHAERVRRYQQCGSLGPLVGIAAQGQVRIEDGSTVIDLPIGEPDLRRLVNGSVMIARAAIASRAKTRFDHAVLGTRRGREVRNEADIDEFREEVESHEDLRLGTSHPQGGNAIGTDAQRSVVDGSFRVRGTDNLYVCDASVFPDVAGVNPQWTVMALAHLCAQQLCA